MGDERGVELEEPAEAFATLGNEIRLSILQELWRAGATHTYDDLTDTAETIPFSQLQRRVEIADNGKFNYHLSQLRPQFVRRTEEGYRLSGAGKRIARTVIAVSGTTSLDGPVPLERDCPLCGAQLTASYDDQWLRVECCDCTGLFGNATPDGTVYLTQYPAAGLRGRSPEEALTTGIYRCMLDLLYLVRGLCRECGGRVGVSVSVCENHATHDTCKQCQTPFPVWADLRCDTCGFAKRLPVELCVLGVTPVVAFLTRHGIDAFEPAFDELVATLHDRIETTVSHDPLSVAVTVTVADETLSLSLDEELSPHGVERYASVE